MKNLTPFIFLVLGFIFVILGTTSMKDSSFSMYYLIAGTLILLASFIMFASKVLKAKK